MDHQEGGDFGHAGDGGVEQRFNLSATEQSATFHYGKNAFALLFQELADFSGSIDFARI